jgi:predicted methyltransferase
MRSCRLLAPALFATLGLAVAAPAATARAPDHSAHRAPSVLPAAAKAALAPVLADPRRKDDAARDVWRHPEAVLALCRIEPGMKVVDYMPGGGWWTKILVPYLGESGRYIALNPDVRAATPQLQQFLGNLAGSFPAKVTGWTGAEPARFDVFNTDGLPPALNGTVDRVMIMRQVHNIHRLGMLFAEMAALRRLMKPGGLLCIEEHRAKPNASADYTDGSKGYVRQADVIALMQAHGFDLAASSEINANPKDSADYPEGVWVLPPTFALREKDRAGYAAIGEADRMTLLFRRRP